MECVFVGVCMAYTPQYKTLFIVDVLTIEIVSPFVEMNETNEYESETYYSTAKV